MDEHRTIGIVGVGVMGAAYARNLLERDYRVVVFDLDPDRTRESEAMGCRVADSVASMFHEHPTVILLSLPSDEAFAHAIGEIARAAAGGAEDLPIVVDTSTLAIAVKELGRDELARVGMTLLDCPVSGTGGQAAERDLVVFASGDSDAIDACERVLDAIAHDIRRVGEFGVGSCMKFLANLLVIVHTTAAAEMLALAERAGIDPMLALDTIAAGSGQSRMLDLRGPQMARPNDEVTATVETFRKDLRIIRDFARSIGASTPLLAVSAELYDEAGVAGWGRRDVTAVLDAYLSREM